MLIHLILLCRIFFTVVSDPMDEDEDDCEDVGIAYLDLLQVRITSSVIILSQRSGDVLPVFTVLCVTLQFGRFSTDTESFLQ